MISAHLFCHIYFSVVVLHVLIYGVFLTPCTGLWCVQHPMYWSMVCSSPHVLVYGVFLTPCTGLWCVFLTPCTGLWCVPHPMYWSMVCSVPHVLVYGVFLTPCTGLWCVPHPIYWSIVCSSPCVNVSHSNPLPSPATSRPRTSKKHNCSEEKDARSKVALACVIFFKNKTIFFWQRVTDLR